MDKVECCGVMLERAALGYLGKDFVAWMVLMGDVTDVPTTLGDAVERDLTVKVRCWWYEADGQTATALRDLVGRALLKLDLVDYVVPGDDAEYVMYAANQQAQEMMEHLPYSDPWWDSYGF